MALGCACALALGTSACGSSGSGSGGSSDQFTSASLSSVIAAVKKEKGSGAELLQVQITAAGTDVQIRDGQKATGLHFDPGSTDGTAFGVQLVGTGSISDTAFPISQVDAASIDKMIGEAPGRQRRQGLQADGDDARARHHQRQARLVDQRRGRRAHRPCADRRPRRVKPLQPDREGQRRFERRCRADYDGDPFPPAEAQVRARAAFRTRRRSPSAFRPPAPTSPRSRPAPSSRAGGRGSELSSRRAARARAA